MAPIDGKPSVPPERPPPERSLEALEELRALIMGPEHRALRTRMGELAEQQADLNGKLENLSGQLSDPQQQASTVANALAEAVVMRRRADQEAETQQLETAIKPVVERSIQSSVRENPHTLAAAIYPVIMPALRKSIAQALEKMLQQINRALEHRFSVQSFRWRIEAARTGTSFAEVVLLHTLEYRVEQVFLIHKETGLLLRHASAIPETARDADVISGMLSAIQAFIQDSFETAEGDALDTIQVGARKVWIEQSPFAVLAAVIQGSPPVELHTLLQETLETVHARHMLDLRNFDGDDSAFEASQPVLENALLAQYKRKSGQNNRAGRWLLALLLVAALTLLFFWWRNNTRWNRYVDRLEAEPGLVLTRAETGHLEGLRDPLSTDPAALLGCEPDGYLSYCHLDAEAVTFDWEPYISPHPRLAEQRARQLLAPPETIRLSVSDDQVMTLDGTAAPAWLEEARRLGPLVPGVARVDVTAPAADPAQVIIERLEALRFTFALGARTLAPADTPRLNALAADLAALDQLLAAQNQQADVHIRGFTSPDGPPSANRIIAQARADALRAGLQQAATRQNLTYSNRLTFRTSGVLPTDPAAASRPLPANNRFVSLEVTLRDP